MTIYNRPRAEVFAENAPPSEIQPFQAWLRGLGIAFDETNGFPEFTGLNGLFNALNQYIKYLEQNGFAEWSADLEYPIGAGVRVGSVWYRAKTQNTNKPPATSQNDWELFLNASALSYENPIYIENNVVKVRDASTTQKGAVQFASATEVASRSNVSKAISPNDVGNTFEQSLQENGWCRLPSGLILQWGAVTVAAQSSVSISFPTAFPVVCLNMQATFNSTNLSVYDSPVGVSFTRIGAIIRNSAEFGSKKINYFAVGR